MDYCHFKTGALIVGDWARSSPNLDPSARSANAKSVHLSLTKVRRRLMVLFPVVFVGSSAVCERHSGRRCFERSSMILGRPSIRRRADTVFPAGEPLTASYAACWWV